MIASLVSRRAGAEEIISLVTADTSCLARIVGRQAEHHDVMGRHQRGEGRVPVGERAHEVLGVEALAAVDRAGRAAIGEGAEEVERVGVAHRHDQQAGVARAEAKLDVGHQRQQRAAAVAADRALRLAGRARSVHQRPRIVGHHGHRRRAVACGCDKILVGAVAGMPAIGAENDEFVGGTREAYRGPARSHRSVRS